MKHFLNIIFLLLLSLLIKFIISPLLKQKDQVIVFATIFFIFLIGIFLIFQTAKIIEHTTGVLKKRTGLAGGLLQALGTALPDMVIGVVSALLSLQAAATNQTRAINLAIIAASTTFGSNIYNVLHATWCLHRQNLADKLDKHILMFPIIGGGTVTPIKTHVTLPPRRDIENSFTILTLLSLITTMVALGMVLFGKVKNTPRGFNRDLYQLTPFLGAIILLICFAILFAFRRHHTEDFFHDEEVARYDKFSTARVWFELLISGIIILFAAEGIIESISVFAEITKVPYVLVGVATALVGCLGEMTVIHNFTIHPKGRIADAVTGVAIDNIVTTMGASFIAILGGIFLGSDALIVIFILILFSNNLLSYEITKLKTHIFLQVTK